MSTAISIISAPLANPSDDLKVIASLPWRQARVLREDLTLDGKELTDDEKTLLRAYSKYIKITEYGSGTFYTQLNAPETNNPSDIAQHKLFDACNATAQKQAKEDLLKIVALPWTYNSASGLYSFIMLPRGDFWLNSDILDAEQKAMLKAFAYSHAYGIEETKSRREGEIKKGEEEYYTLYGINDGEENILNRLVGLKLETEIKADFAVLSQLKWAYEKDGSLVSSVPESLKHIISNPVKALTDGTNSNTTSDAKQITTEVEESDAEKLFGSVKNIMVKRDFLFNPEGNIKLSRPNTVGKIYDSKDGDTDIARCRLYSLVEQQTINNAKTLFADLKDLDWKYGTTPMPAQLTFDKVKRTAIALVHPEKSCFYIEKSNLSAEQINSLLEFEGGFASVDGDYIKISDHTIIGQNHKLKLSLHDVKARFINDLSSKISLPEIPQEILDLPWSYSENSVYLPNKLNSTLAALTKKHNISIAGEERGNLGETLEVSPYCRDKFAISNISFVLAVKKNTEKKQDEFIAQNTDKIAALPWKVFADTDLTSEYWAIHVSKEDLNESQKELLSNLENLGLVRPHDEYKQGQVIQVKYRNAYCGKMNPILQPILEAKQNQLAEEYAKLDWKWDGNRHSDFRLKDAEMPTEKGYGVFQGQWSTTEISNYHYPDINVHPREFHGIMLRKLAEKFGKDVPQTLDADLAELNWHYETCNKGEIILDGSNLDEETLERLRKAIPDNEYRDEKEKKANLPRTKFVIHGDTKKDSFSALGIMHKGLYEAIAPAADKNYARTIENAAKLPWQKDADDRYFVIKNKLTTAQQEILDRINFHENFDGEIFRASGYQNATQNFTIKPSQTSQPLVAAIEKNQGLHLTR